MRSPSRPGNRPSLTKRVAQSICVICLRPSAPLWSLGCRSLRSNTEYYCAGLSYVDLARGHLDMAFFWRSKAWDHLPGALILSEAGGHCAYLDGLEYGARSGRSYGLLASASRLGWEQFATGLFGGIAEMVPVR